jgi:HKD family nuclease
MEVVLAKAVSQLIERVRREPRRYREIVFCVPFIDELNTSAICSLAPVAIEQRCGFRLITRSAAASTILTQLPGPEVFWQQVIHVNNRVHAKVYLALARSYRDSEAIVTSANLTANALLVNEELGIRVLARTDLERQVLVSIRSSIYNLLR